MSVVACCKVKPPFPELFMRPNRYLFALALVGDLATTNTVVGWFSTMPEMLSEFDVPLKLSDVAVAVGLLLFTVCVAL